MGSTYKFDPYFLTDAESKYIIPQTYSSYYSYNDFGEESSADFSSPWNVLLPLL